MQQCARGQSCAFLLFDIKTKLSASKSDKEKRYFVLTEAWYAFIYSPEVLISTLSIIKV